MSLDIRLARPVAVSFLQLHNQAVVQLDVMLAKRLCSNNARPSGSSGTLLTPFTLQLKLQALVYDILPSTTAVFSYVIGS